MAETQFRFEDGAAYERMMGVWSRMAGDIFLDWVAPPPGLRWVDIGCGNGVFTEVVCGRCAPAEIDGIDPSAAQIAYARTRPGARLARFHEGNAMTLPFADDSFDAAVMALVIFFVPDPAKAVAEMARVARPGGLVATYAWDQMAGGSPQSPIQAELRAMGYDPHRPPSSEASRMPALRQLWADAGVESLETREIVVTRSFADFDDFWSSSATGPSIAPILAVMTADDIERLKERLRSRLPPDGAGRIAYDGRANAIKGRMPK